MTDKCKCTEKNGVWYFNNCKIHGFRNVDPTQVSVSIRD